MWRLAGGVSESIHTFGIFASFKSQGALAEHEDPTRASRPFDLHRNGIVVAEGGCVFVLERLDDAKRRGAKIYGELVGYAMNTDATDFVLPNPQRQAECVRLALETSRLGAGTDRHRQHARDGHQQRRHAGMCGAARGLRRLGQDLLQQHQELYRPLHGRGRGAWNWRAICPSFRRRRVPRHDQRGRTGSGVRTARVWWSTSRARSARSTTS